MHRIRTLFAAALLLLPGLLSDQEVRLEVGQTRSGTLASGDTASFTFQAGDDFLLYGEVSQISVDVVVTLENADGQRVGPARGAEAFSTSIAEAGLYTLKVAPFEEETCYFEVTILLLEAEADDPERLADQLMFAYDRPGSPGGAIQVWRDGRTVFSKASTSGQSESPVARFSSGARGALWEAFSVSTTSPSST